MSIELWLAFVAASSIMLVIPGPTILTVVAYATANGRSATLPLVLGVSFGDFTLIFLSIFGLGSLLAISSTAFNLVKIVGGLYLLYLGIKMLCTANATTDDLTQKKPEAHSTLFFNAWLVTALNPKGLIFFGAFFPQFINLEAPITPQLIILSSSFVCLAALNTLGYALLASKASNALSSNKAKQNFGLFGGLTMSAAGLWALSSKL